MTIPTIEDLKKDKIIPRVFPDDSINLSVDIFVSFKAGKDVKNGNEIDISGTGIVPRTVKFSQEPPDGYCYVLVMVDPDYPSRKKPDGSEYLHWVISGIKTKELIKGTADNTVTLLPYVGPALKKGTGKHRLSFILLLIEEERKQDIQGIPVFRGQANVRRVKFNDLVSTYNFAKVNNMQIVGYTWCLVESL